MLWRRADLRVHNGDRKGKIILNNGPRQTVKHFPKVSEASAAEALKAISPLLREIAGSAREALARWYATGDSVESICANGGMTPKEFCELRQSLRDQFKTRYRGDGCKAANLLSLEQKGKTLG